MELHKEIITVLTIRRISKFNLRNSDIPACHIQLSAQLLPKQVPIIHVEYLKVQNFHASAKFHPLHSLFCRTLYD